MVEGGGGGTVEPVTALDPQALLRVKTAPRNLHSFFSPAARSLGTMSLPPSAGVKRAAEPLTPGSSGRGRGRRVAGTDKGCNNPNPGSTAEGMLGLFGFQRSVGALAMAKTRPTTGTGGPKNVISIDD